MDQQELSPPPSLDIPYALRRIPNGLRIIANDGAPVSVEPRQSLIKALVRGYMWRQQLELGDVASYQELAEQAGVTRRYVARILRLGFLGPDLFEAILAGKQDPAVTTQMFRKPLSHDWEIQCTASKFATPRSV